MTGGWMSAHEAERRGMVNRVVPRDELRARTLELAETIAARNSYTMKLVKQAMNFAQDQMGRKASMDFGFHMHQIGHMQAMLVHGFPIDVESLPPATRAQVEKLIAAGRAAKSPS